MRHVIITLIIVFCALCPPRLHAKQMDCVVTVVDTQGRPIRGAEVSVWEQDFDWGGSHEVTTKQLINPVNTDGNGNAQIQFVAKEPDHSIIILAQRAGFSVGWDSAFQKARITNIRIVLDRINATAGIVTDEQNQPIAGAKVTAYPVDEEMVEGHLAHLRWPDSFLMTKTDHEGRFSFDCLAEWMEVGFRVEYPGRAYTDTTYDIEANHLPLYKAGQKDIHIVMHPAGGIKGRILAKRGNKIGGIQLIARGERIRNGKLYFATSDSDGSFKFNDLPPDAYLVTTARAKDKPSQQLTAGAIAEVDVGKTINNVKIRMRDPVKLDVLVKNTK
ncbi:MAG: carboxypeptidase-like regulatory domain-containing protein, partial [Planctomycetota bacterium]